MKRIAIVALVALLGAGTWVGAQSVSNYIEQGGARTVIGGELDIVSGGELDVESGGALKIAGTAVTASGAEINKTDGVTASAAEISANADGAIAAVSFAAAAGGTNVAEVTVTPQDGDGATVAGANLLHVWLSDDSGCAALTATTASGTVQAKSGEGADFGELTAKKALVVQTKAAGTYVLEITDTANTGFYVGANVPGTGLTACSAQLAAGDYGS